MTEQRLVLQNCGRVDPANIDSWLAAGGFAALDRARAEHTPEEVIAWLKASGLRGRGGAGFPTGLKWELTSKSAGPERYVICNADEGEVGTFKDRYILERDPFTLIEAIAIACYAIGARRAFIYLRDEYRDLLPHLRNAIVAAHSSYPLGCEIQIREAAGAYVCGEESGLMESIEGRRGEPRFRPPFPPSSGLWAKPTVIQNVETLMNVPAIIRNGPEWFAGIGTAQSKGTKVFSVSGDVAQSCVCEVPMGTPLREVVEGIAGAHDIKMVQVGGASGRVVPSARLDTPLAYEGVLGAGAITVYGEGRDTIEIGLRTLEFFAEECCGKCSPCRQGCEALVGILERLAQSRARASDLSLLRDIADNMMLASLCGLGQAAPNFVVDTLQAFGDEYLARVLA
ncbi:MAG: NADH-quinone oxidoreductase subunit F [Chloroflexi bacterium]|nr:NADH-quinone oxidoreductase subunit F [Chloroflexota bacterium]MCL5110824.1 NADH-quinone oxidoreductase subunit F [Chloroflexota bacterium]